MPIGAVSVPTPPTIGAFPVGIDYGSGFDLEPPIVTHTFDQAGLRTEQRFILGDGVRRFRVRKVRLACNEYDQLKAHWLQAQGSYAQFPFTYPGILGPTVYTVRYENPNLSFVHLVGMLTGDPGITLIEVPSVVPTYTASAPLTRFPDATLEAALTAQVQQIIPLIEITPRDGSARIDLSNQKCRVNGVLYEPRLLDWAGISQTLGENSDRAQFTFGNADRVFYTLTNQVSLHRAVIQFALYHKQSQCRVNLWTGYALPWSFDSEGRFLLDAADGVFELNLSYPARQVSRTCWKVYKGRFCPSTSSLPDCPKSFEACLERGVPKSFGGVVVKSIAAAPAIKHFSTGVHGWGRSTISSVTIADDTVYQRTIQEIYTDIPMVVNCDVAGGRDESDFYSAIGIVGEGPIGGYSTNLIEHKLDGSPPHDPLRNGGWRGILGNDPANTNEFFGLDEFPWGNWVPPNSTYAAGLAFAEIRRSDEKGLQLAKIQDRVMKVTVTKGIGGWTWTAPGTRAWTPALSNPIWVAINVYLRGRGLKVIPANESLVSAAMMEQYFDVTQAIAMATICDTVVPKMVGTGTERQFPFRGVLKERKPLKDWLQEILNCCLGYYTFVNGKLWIGIRINSSVLAGNGFTRDTILWKTLQAAPVEARFNWFTGQFGDEEFNWDLNSVTAYDIDHAELMGTPDSPQYISGDMTYVGVSNKSQASRLVATRLREELGGIRYPEEVGIGAAEQRNARSLRFKTTVLALRTMVGDVISLDHADLPTGRVEGRTQKWTLNPDYSIDIEASPSNDSMYVLTVGPKPADVPAERPRPEILPSPYGLAWMPNSVAPFLDDPLYPDPNERTFAVWQDYEITREGIWEPAIWSSGEYPINEFIDTVQPRIVGIAIGAASSGTLTGPQTIYAAVTQRDAEGKPATPSNLAAIFIDTALTNRSVALTLSPASGTWTGYDVWVGTDRRRLGWQFGANGVLPSTLQIPGPIHQMTQGAPSAAARGIHMAAKHVWHSGIAGVLVTGVEAPNRIQANDFIGSLDQWIGRYLSCIADQSDGSAPLWNFEIIGYDPALGMFSVRPICVRENPPGTADPENSVQVGDVLIVRSIATSADAESVTDTMWNNSVSRVQFDSPGLEPGKEEGRVCRILRGKGAGQTRSITGNTNTRIEITPPWDIIPDTSSIIIVEAADWVYTARSSDLKVDHSGVYVDLRMRLDNLRDRVALVGGFLVDDQGRLTDEAFAVYREIYIFGQPPTVRWIGPEQLDPKEGGPWLSLPTDHTIRANTTSNDVDLQLSPLYAYQGRTLQIFNDGPADSHDVNVTPSPGETLHDGSTSVALKPGQMLKVTAG